jgi:DNA polymerase
MQLELPSPTDFDAWRTQARWLAARDIAAEHVHWRVRGEVGLFDGLFDGTLDEPPAAVDRSHEGAHPPAQRVPRAFVDLARCVILHRDPARFALLYRVLLRLKREPRLLDVAVDADVAQLHAFERQVRHDQHRMHAYVRFRRTVDGEGERFIAWYAPEHHIVEATADFFVRRFAGQRWAILTPARSALWDGQALTFGPGVPRSAAPTDDALEDLWRTYYASTFNPARLNVDVLQGHLPRRFWSQLPEAQLIAPLVAQARAQAGQMVQATPRPPRRQRAVPAAHAEAADAIDAIEPVGNAAAFKARLDDCRRCPLGAAATQAVPGDGPLRADLMLVGEQPGDHEDLAGRPFVGPAGQLLDRALAEAGLDRARLYLTNAVKHFKFEPQITPRGKRRLHKTPIEQEIAACEGWLQHELEQVAPTHVVALGATAARALLGRRVKIAAVRGRWLAVTDGASNAAPYRVLVTVHPSFLLRIAPERFEAEYAAFVGDLRLAAARAEEG